MTQSIDVRRVGAGDERSTQSSQTVVTFERVSKRFGSVEALRDVSFSVRQGEVVALLGPNGAGKTTAISLLLGLRPPTSGQVRLWGLDPREHHTRSRCGVMLQESGVPPTLSVRETVALFRSYYPHPLPTRQVLALAGLEEKAGARTSALSGGQRQRLYFALAICGDPNVLFLDEPTAALDVEARRAFWTQIRAFAQAGKTVLFTTHYLEEADALAERVLLIARGQVIADATPTALKSRVAGRRVRFDLARPLDEAAFAGLPVRQLELTPEHASLLTPDPEVVLQALFARGATLSNLEVVGASLEEAVIALTQNAHA